MAVDIASGPSPLVHALHASGRQYAVACGALVALLSLFNDTPVRIASLRGAIAWGSVLFIVSIATWFTRRAWPAPEPEEDEASDEEGEAAAPANGAPANGAPANRA